MTELPKGWVRTRLEEICEILDFKRIPVNSKERSQRIEGKARADLYPYFGATGQVGVIDGFLFEGEHVLIGEDGAPFLDASKATAYLATGRFWVNNHAHILQSHGSNAFLCHYLNSIRYEDHVSGTTRLKLTKSALIAIPVLFPPLNEQRRIVQKIEAMFEQIDKGVESLAAAKTTLGLYRQSLLKSAFEGRLTATWRAQNPDKLESPKSLLARIQKERETRYKSALDNWQTALSEWRANGEQGRKPGKPSRPDWPAGFDFQELKALPDGWLYLPFEALAWSIRNGISAKPDGQGPLKIFRISAVRARAFDLEDFRRITDTDGSMSVYRLSYGDLVFTRYNGSRDYVGVSAMYRGDGSHVYPDKLIRCEFKSDLLNPAYLELATNCGESRAHLERLIRTTAGQSGISGGDVKSMPVPICSPAEQAEITRILDARLTAADAMEAEINAALLRAEALRQSILKQAFSGTLVPQDPTDEPAPTLLARIKAERAKAGKTKPRKTAHAG